MNHKRHVTLFIASAAACLLLFPAASAQVISKRALDKIQWAGLFAHAGLVVVDHKVSLGRAEASRFSRDERGVYSPKKFWRAAGPLLALDTAGTYLLTRKNVHPAYKVAGLAVRAFTLQRRIRAIASHY